MAIDIQKETKRLEVMEEKLGQHTRLTHFYPIGLEADSCYGKSIPHRVWCAHECISHEASGRRMAIARRNGCAAVVILKG